MLIWIGARKCALQSRCGNRRTVLGPLVEAASRATASRPALGTATISRGRRMRRQHSASCRCGEPPRSFGISARPLGHAADADEPPDGSWVAALPPWTSWSAHAPGDTLLASKCDGDLTLLRVASSRVVLLGAPSLVALPPSSCAGPQWPRVAVARGRQLRSRDGVWGDWWLSTTVIGILIAAVRLPALVAHLHLRVRARSSPHNNCVLVCAAQVRMYVILY